MVKLNGSAGEILKRCDGERRSPTSSRIWSARFGTAGLAADVIAFIAMARGRSNGCEMRP